jgi:hypothetical protein
MTVTSTQLPVPPPERVLLRQVGVVSDTMRYLFV